MDQAIFARGEKAATKSGSDREALHTWSISGPSDDLVLGQINHRNFIFQRDVKTAPNLIY
jgi:hypothetical protein